VIGHARRQDSTAHPRGRASGQKFDAAAEPSLESIPTSPLMRIWGTPCRLKEQYQHGRLSQIQPDPAHLPRGRRRRDGGRGRSDHHRALGALAGILSAVIFAFTLTIQEFTYTLTFITSSGQQTVSVGVPTNLVRGDVYFWGSLMAACLITSIPVAILYNLFLDRFISGFTVGAIK
jgi:hypothetical protein